MEVMPHLAENAQVPQKMAVVWGVTGQDGSYLSELLLEKGYTVVGVSRRSSTPNDLRIRHLLGRTGFHILQGDITDAFCVHRILTDVAPDEVYNLAAQSHVGVSFCEPSHTWQATACGALNILESIRMRGRPTRFYQASSSEMFGSAYSFQYQGRTGPRVWHHRPGDLLHLSMLGNPYQDEDTPMHPNSPYAVAKLAAHHLCRIYRESYGIFACSGILFNHESERRGEEFVTRKIAKYAARFAWARDHNQTIPPLRLGNMEARRDWGYAPDYVRAMHLMLQQDRPDDFVVATGETHSVREFLHAAFAAIGETGEVAELSVECDPALKRPCEVPYLCGNADKAKRVLGWVPEITFAELVRRMVLYEIESLTT